MKTSLAQIIFHTPKTPLQKVEWYQTKTHDINEKLTYLFKEVKLKNPLNEDIYVSSGKQPGSCSFMTQILDKNKKPAAFQLFNVNYFSKYLYGKNMELNDPLKRNTGLRYGETLWLTGIMEMFQNGLNEIRIFAAKEAPFFHAKYKFVPNMTEKEEISKFLEWTQDLKSNEFENIKQNALKLLEQVNKEKNVNISDPGLIEDINNLANEFIQTALMKQKHPEEQFKTVAKGMDMILTKENIEKNREFFNELYKKHGIDYKI